MKQLTVLGAKATAAPDQDSVFVPSLREVSGASPSAIQIDVKSSTHFWFSSGASNSRCSWFGAMVFQPARTISGKLTALALSLLQVRRHHQPLNAVDASLPTGSLDVVP